MALDQRPLKVLVIEDNPGDQLLICEHLISAFALPIISTASSYSETKSYFSDEKSSFDVILLDVNLPDFSGIQLIEKIVALAPITPVLVLSGLTDLSFSIESLALGVSDYLIKDDITDKSLYKSIIYSLERSKIVKKFQTSERQYSDLFYLSAEAKLVIEPENLKIIKANKVACTLYGLSESELQGLTISDICTKEHLNEFKADVQNLHDSNVHPNKFYQHKDSQNTLFFIEFKTSSIVLNDENLQVLHINNITDRIVFEQKISQAILKTQETERHEIGSELHDNVCQLLATSQLNMSMFEDQLSENAILYYTQGKNLINKALEEIRILSHQLAPSIFDDSTLSESIETLIDSMNVNKSLEIDLQIPNELMNIHLGIERHLHVFRILQEQLRNIIKHSQATKVLIHFSVSEERVTIKVADNGIGFNPLSIKNGIGFSNMKRRVEIISGKLAIEATPNEGCTILVVIPID